MFWRPELPVVPSMRHDFIGDVQRNPPAQIVVFDRNLAPPYDQSGLAGFPDLAEL